jgi:hypothetical protein
LTASGKPHVASAIKKMLGGTVKRPFVHGAATADVAA